MKARRTAAATILIGIISFSFITLQLSQATTSSEEEQEEQEQIEFESYTNEDFKFTIAYPFDDWEPQETSLNEYEVVRFVPKEPPAAVTMIYITDTTHTNKTLNELIDQGIEDPNNTGRYISRTNTTLSGLPAVQQVYYQYDYGTVKSMETTTLTDTACRTDPLNARICYLRQLASLLNLQKGGQFLIFTIPDRDENRKNLYNNNNTHNADK
jgi:hypothetical protein